MSIRASKAPEFLLILMLCLAAGILGPRAHAIEEAIYSTETFNQHFVYPNMQEFTKTPDGGVAWDLFARTQEDEVFEGSGNQKRLVSVTPTFADGLKALSGKTILMSGYMFPLNDAGGQSRFFFGPFPMTCLLHYHVPPTLVIEAWPRAPLPFTYSEIIVQGQLELVENPGLGPYYRLLDIVLVSQMATGGSSRPTHPLLHGTPVKPNPDDALRGGSKVR